MKRPFSYIVAPVLAVLVIASALACDTATTEAESDFAYFVGTWTVASVSQESGAQFDPGDVTFRFFESDGRERFSVSGETASGQSVNIDGQVLPGVGDEFALTSDDFVGEPDFVEIRYNLQNDMQVALHTNERENGAALMRVLLNQDVANVTLILVRSATAA